MGYQTWVSPLNSPGNPAAGSALVSSAALTDISSAPQCVIPGNTLQVGSRIRATAFGVFSTTGTPTLLLGAYYGGVAGVALAATLAAATGSGVANVPWRLEYTGIVRSTGASGTIIGQGFVLIGTSVSAAGLVPIPATALATVTIDTTSAKALTVGAQWGTSSASDTITCHDALFELLGV